ncbi:MAG: [protein-PII] uridylyltransferase [Verrucomicrobia bacterium]|nr:[protein-PII] uridylyltransferase [Verrucomicrobiota bacterium]
MKDVLRKIESDAQEKLSLTGTNSSETPLARCKAFLKREMHRIKLAHQNGGGGLEICKARATVMDHIIRHLWQVARSSLSTQAQQEFPPIALVALGGYGRGELNPFSDVDLMFLHDGQVAGYLKPLPVLEKVMNGVWLPLFDLGLKPGHSVRTIAECVAAANDKDDLRSVETRTSLIEARLIIGDEKLFAKFQKIVLAKCVTKYVDKYIAARLNDQATRRTKFGNSACMQEPNIKNGSGGLRDFQNLLWMAFFKYGTRSLAELQKHELVVGRERKQLEEAYDFLLRVRTELHYNVSRPTDALTKNLQPAVAHALGYTERSPSKRIEKFMRDVYTHMRNVLIITRTLEQRMAFVPESQQRMLLRMWLGAGRKAAVSEPVDGFKFINGEIHATSNRVFRDQPRRLMRVFLHAQQRGMRLHPDLAQLIRSQVSLVDREFLNDERVAETFLEILNQRGGVAPILRAMHEVDLLGKYIPEFGKLTCLVQHEFYHQYAADEHTLMCIEQLDRIWEAKEPPYDKYTPLFQELERPFLIYLSLLLHDTGKPDGHGKHSEVGAKLAQRVGRRLTLEAPAMHTLEKAIEHHLLMAIISQRHDMDDTSVIRNFSRQVESVETLKLLTLVTFVDALATSDKLWNGFKDSLLWQLHQRALPLLTGGTEFVRVEELQREELRLEVRALLPVAIDDEELRAHFSSLPPRYYQIHTAQEIHDDILLAHRFMRLQVTREDSPLAPVANLRNEPDRGYSAVRVCTWDRAGLFCKMAGSLSAVGLNILSAQIFTRSDGIALDTYFVTDAFTGKLATNEQRDEFEALLTRVLADEPVDLHALIAKQKISRPLYQAYTGEQIPTRVSFDNEASDTRTFIAVETEDRIGLLYTIAEALTELELDISTARICTEKGAAIDSFYVREIDGGKILSPERQKAIEKRLFNVILKLGAKI